MMKAQRLLTATLLAIIYIALSAVLMPATSTKVFANTSIPSRATHAAVMPPREIAQVLDQARKLGQSRLVVFGFNIYDAKLWASEGFDVGNYASSGFALEIRYLRNFGGSALAERSLKEMRNQSQVSDTKAQEWLDLMRKTFPDVKKGDQLIGIHRADGTSSFILNGKPIGEVRDTEFSRLFFGIWLSPKTSEPKMRRELMGATHEGK
jgi:Chalcone isomerase-like